MQWLDVVAQDPVPWLLDPENPSVRLLTLRHIFGKPEEALAAERARLLEWKPIQSLRYHWNAVNFWGRAHDPYYGGAMGNFGTLYTLTQWGVPKFPEVEPACENLLTRGRSSDGRFSPGESLAAPWLCYTGIALQIMSHFDLSNDLRVRSAKASLIQAILLRPELLDCPVAGGPCRAGLVKALGALVNIPPSERSSEEDEAIDVLCERLLNAPYDFEGQNAELLMLGTPRYYDADLSELCHVIAQTPYRSHHRFHDLLGRLIDLQTPMGRWRKRRSTPAYSDERLSHPSRWVTFEATHTLMLVYGGNTYAT